MDTDLQWLTQELDNLFDKSSDYQEKAYILGIKDLLEDQETRRTLLEGELDGTLWSPDNWEI